MMNNAVAAEKQTKADAATLLRSLISRGCRVEERVGG
jgi:hypothetical protein